MVLLPERVSVFGAAWPFSGGSVRLPRRSTRLPTRYRVPAARVSRRVTASSAAAAGASSSTAVTGKERRTVVSVGEGRGGRTGPARFYPAAALRGVRKGLPGDRFPSGRWKDVRPGEGLGAAASVRR